MTSLRFRFHSIRTEGKSELQRITGRCLNSRIKTKRSNGGKFTRDFTHVLSLANLVCPQIPFCVADRFLAIIDSCFLHLNREYLCSQLHLFHKQSNFLHQASRMLFLSSSVHRLSFIYFHLKFYFFVYRYVMVIGISHRLTKLHPIIIEFLQKI